MQAPPDRLARSAPERLDHPHPGACLRRRLLVTAALLTVAACSGEPTSPAFPDDAAGTAHSVKFWEAGSSVHWNARAVTLFRARGGPAGRMLTYLALAQYRAVLAAERGVAGAILPSSAAAAAGASTVVLKQFFPLDADALEAELAAQRAGPQGSSEKQKDFAAGEAIGRALLRRRVQRHRGRADRQASPDRARGRAHLRLRQCRGLRRQHRLLRYQVHLLVFPAIEGGCSDHHAGGPAEPSLLPVGSFVRAGAWEAVLVDAFPSERESIVASAQEAGLSRLYGGIHYRFDMEAGEALGLAAGRLALQRGGLE